MNYQWYPGHMTKAKRMMEENIKLIDLVIEIVDARIPISSRNPDIDSLAVNKARIILLNKSDLADDKITNQWINYFNENNIYCLKLNSRNNSGIKQVNGLIMTACADKIERNKQRGILNRPIRAMVVGIPNVGKSTFINLILRLYTPCRGQILINNINIDNINIHSYRENICTVLQTDDLFKGTIEDNITVYKRYNLPMELLNLNLFSFINKYHSGIDTKIESKSSGVSGGEKQKIALLRALNKSGRILVLDEPTSNYDQESEEEFIKLISELKYDIIIIVTHSEKIVNIANKVIKLEKRI